MKEDEFGDAAMEAFAFSGSLIGSINASVGTLQMLVWKGQFTKEEAMFVLDTAQESAARMNLPEPFQSGVAGAYESAKESIEANSLTIG
ncbi:hypothetical protein [Qipengyuania sp.]|uniref:hypothetical protein n=1 Tax=Qipengyuania sp. TaxID=2004515 RepID=UPI003BAA8BC5